jgi:hypothetical protein
VLRKTRPLGGNSSNHLTVIIAEHHINLLTHGEVTHRNKAKRAERQQEMLRRTRGKFFRLFDFHSRSMRHRNDMLRFTPIHILCYICFLFSFFLLFWLPLCRLTSVVPHRRHIQSVASNVSCVGCDMH